MLIFLLASGPEMLFAICFGIFAMAVLGIRWSKRGIYREGAVVSGYPLQCKLSAR